MFECQKCGKPATVHYIETINGKKRELHLCSHCATFDSVAFANENVRKSGRACECGMSEKELRLNGKLGCSKCYNVFADILSDYILEHGGNHIGKKLNPYQLPLSERERLYQALLNAEKAEDYIEAGRIKALIDKINGI